MRRRSPVEAVLTGVVSTLRASTGLTGLLGSSTGVYNNPQQGASMPHVIVTSPTDSRMDTMSRFGSELQVQVRAVSDARGDQQAAQVLDRAIDALNFATIATTAPYASLGVSWDQSERYSEVVNGVVVRHHVGLFRVWAEQTS